ncbi:hypothetical protein [Synechococcus sp. RS9902]|uniref:hypothetical protein n=1 Tax=Synechococcus sp. RS9902 TaxID=221345 RepID=UPI001646B120|nr:hypothetical protein [Synechococcus sp. RS9902]QNI98060.1 alkaline phosphatase [Synechococcus sp. RS9902]
MQHIGKCPVEGRFLDEHRGCPAHFLWHASPVTLGSNWPAQAPGRPPRPGVVAIHRASGEPLLAG